MALNPQDFPELQDLDVKKELAKLRQPLAEQEAAPAVAPSNSLPKPVPHDQLQAPIDPNDWSSAIGRGVDTLQSDFGAGLSVAGQLTGSSYLQAFGEQMAEDNRQEAAQYGTPDFRSYKDVDPTSVGSIGQYLKNSVGEALPSFSTVTAGAIAGGKAGSPFGLEGKVIGSAIGGFLSAIGVNVGSVENQMKEIDPEQNHPWTALLTGGAISVFDAVGAHAIAAPLLKHFGKDAAFDLMIQSGIPKKTAVEAVTQVAMGAAKGGAIEAATSAGQSVFQDLSVANATQTRMNPQDIVERAINAALAGSVFGGAARGVTEAVDFNRTQANAEGTGREFAPVDQSTAANQPVGLLGKAWQALGSAATEMLTPWANVSPEAKALQETFRADMTGRTASKQTIFENQELQAGKWNTQLTDIMRGKNEAERQAIIDDASLPKPQTVEGKAFRALQDDVIKEANTRGGLKTGYIEGHMPFGLDPAKVATPEFIQDILPAYKGNIDAATKARDEWLAYAADTERGNTVPTVDRIVTRNPVTGQLEIDPRFQMSKQEDTMRGRFAQGDTIPTYGHLEESRAFNAVPQQVLNKYTLNTKAKDRIQEIRDYYEGASRRIAWSENFGSRGEKLNARIAKAVKEAQEKGRRVSDEEVTRMYDLADAYNGMYGRIKDPSLRTALSSLNSIAVVSRLPLAGLSTLTEFAIPFAKADVPTALRAVFPTIAETIHQALNGVFSRVPRSETGRLMSDLNLTLEAATSLAADRIGTNLYSQLGQKATRSLFLVNGMSLITHMNRIFAVKTAESVFNNNLSDLANGLPFTSANGMQKVNQLREMGVDVSNAQQARALYAPQTPSEVIIADQTKALAIRRFVDQSVLDPTFADKPLWMNNGMVQVAGMLKGYPAAYGNIIVPMLARRLSPNAQGSFSNAAIAASGVAFSLGLMMSLGYIQDDLKTRAKGVGSDWQDQRTDDQRFYDVFAQQTPLQVSIMYDMLTAQRKGSSPVEVLAGPTVGVVSEGVNAVGKTISSFENDPTSGHIWEYLYKQTPARPFQAGKKALKEAFDLGQ